MGSESSHALVAQSDLILTVGLDVVEYRLHDTEAAEVPQWLAGRGTTDVVDRDPGHGTGLDRQQVAVVPPLGEPADPALGMDVASDGQEGKAHGAPGPAASVTADGAGSMWCREPESNRHGATLRGILSPLRLPISPSRHAN